MQDNDLKQLEKIKIPDTSKTAKSRALSAAMEEFDKENSIILKNNENNSQGFSDYSRHIGNKKQNLWSIIMKKQLLVGTALAGVVAVMVGLPMLKESKPFDTKVVKDDITISSKPVEVTKSDAKDKTKGEHLQSANNSQVAAVAEEVFEQNKGGNDDSFSQKSLAIADASAPQAKMIERAQDTQRMASSDLIYNESMNSHGSQKRMIAPYPTTTTMPHPSDALGYVESKNNDKFSNPETNPVKRVSSEPVSTISVDVDTASYSYIRRTLNSGRSINKDSIRVEELINYFDYKYPYPQNSTTPFQPTMSLYPTPWNEETKLLHIGIKGYDIVPDSKPRSNLVFLLDVSGSMNSTDKLPLLKNAFRMLVNNLDENDTVSIVTYAGYAGTALTPTKVSEKEKILAALNNLRSGGSTAGAQGIQQAYALAEQNFDKEGVNRIILATDGDFNVGMSSNNDLKRLIEEKRKSGIFLSILGFGRGNYNDSLMQTLAQNGNGNAAYIDNINEARKVLVDEASSTLFPIAKDVKIQIEFNPALVSEYRLIGYETRILRRQDFNNDKIDAGDIGSGHTVTAIYEITPVGSKAQIIDDLRYEQPKKVAEKVDNMGATNTNEYAFLKMRYKLPSEDTSTLVQLPVTTELEFNGIEQTSTEVRFATAVAAFGQKIRNEEFIGSFSYDDIINLAQDAKGDDKFGYRSEFLNLVRTAKSLDGNNHNHQYYERY